MARYLHTQPGHLMRLSLGLPVLALLVASAFLPAKDAPALLAIAGVLIAVLALFHDLTVEVDDTHLRLRFGLGLVRFRFPLAEIRSAEPVRNLWLAGWGIRLLGNGWLFNVSGLDAVEIRLASGRIHRIGTDDPEALCGAIRTALGERHG